jgi:thermostable 8-oxoguanine DNA glycosylase
MENIFKSKDQILELIQRTDNQGETKRLTQKFQHLKTERREFYLTIDELEEIFKWKLRTQYGRQAKKRSLNTNENIISITRTAFGITHTEDDYETKLKLKILTSITGVEIPVASAILTLCYPEKYSVIDFRNWNQIYKSEKKKTNYTSKEYNDYLKIIRNLASNFELTTQEIDIAIWQKDRDQK